MLLKIKVLFVAILFAASIHSTVAQTFEPVKQLAQRRIPWLAKHLVLTTIPPENGKDVFELHTKGDKVYIGATNANTAATGLNWYLKYYCHRSMSHLGDNLDPVSPLPYINEKIRKVSQFPVRYALNYCTINYAMSFYTWKDWERELDWMALNGVNLMLAPIGMEAVWQNTMKKLGFSSIEIADFIPGPAFTGWWLMGNLEGWGGPVSQNMIDQQVILQKKILSRMKELSIEPVLQGFYGMVPTTLKKKMNVPVVEQGKWAGDFQRPGFLLPTDPFFKKIAGIYYSEIKKLYGGDIKYFGADPFHEGGSSKGVNITASAKEIQGQMQAYFPGSTWMLMGWGGNPSPKLLNGTDKSKTMVIELFGENQNNWEQTKGYDNTPFIWSNVTNFGEKTGMYSKLQRFATEVYRAKKSQYGNLMQGVGIIPEGINNNPVGYDLMLELAWHKDSVDVKEWLKNYALYRYGKTHPAVEKAWQLLLETVYSSPEVYQEGPGESIFCARPSASVKTVSTWGTRTKNYDIHKLEEAVKLFVSVADQFKGSKTYQTDKTDMVRQVLANKGDAVYKTMTDAIEKKDVQSFTAASNQFVYMIQQQDSLLKNNTYFQLNTWLQQADNFGTSQVDKALALRNAKVQISYWGPNNPKTNLHDYAHKEWSGLLTSLYLPRWELFIDNEIKKLNNQPSADIDYFNMEKVWSENKNLYSCKPLSPKEEENLINRILN